MRLFGCFNNQTTMAAPALSGEVLSEEKSAEDETSNSNEKESKLRKCPKCGNHGIKNIWKGHKRLCRFKRCPCVKCKLVDERRNITKQQVRLYRNPEESLSDALAGMEGMQEPLEKWLSRAPVDVPTLYLVILKACHYDLERSIMVIAQAKEEMKHALQEQAGLFGIPSFGVNPNLLFR